MKYLIKCMAFAAALISTSSNAETINCTEIIAVPVVITAQGVYCLKGNLSTSLTVGNMIDIQTNNVTVDFNGFKLGGLAAGIGTFATGINAEGRKNITIRNGSIRGFLNGINFFGSGSSGHLIEDMLFDGNRRTGISVGGDRMVIRNNRVSNTGPTATATDQAFGISVSGTNMVVEGNIVSGVSETNFAIGIGVSNSSRIEIRGNTVFDVMLGTNTRGINLGGNSNDVVIVDNRVINAGATGAVGLFVSTTLTTGIICIGNSIIGFTTDYSGCNFLAGNLPPSSP